MNKEVLVAIAIGIILGLGGALYFSNQKPVSKVQELLNTNRVSVIPKNKRDEGLLFSKLPRNGIVVTQPQLKIAGKTGGLNTLVVANILDIQASPIKKDSFVAEVDLKPGHNEIIIAGHGKNTEQLKVIKLFYLKQPKKVITSDTSISTEATKESTSEGALLKQKLEDKVLELRSNAKKALSGKVKSLNAKEVVMEIAGKQVKVALEAEVTKFYLVDGSLLEELELEDIVKNDIVTVFISDIGGEEKSYMVYKEPSKQMVAGKISNVDSQNYTLSIVNFDKTILVADVQTNSLQQSYDEETEKVQRYGFSKIAIGDYVYAIVSYDKENNRSYDHYLILPKKQ